MASVIAFLRSAVLFDLARVALLRSDADACDAGQLAGALSSKALSSSKELWRLCNSRYAEGVCIAAGRTLSEKFSSQNRGDADVSLLQWAGAACNAVEAAASQPRALLLRQHRMAPQHRLSRADDASAVQTRDIANIRSSASVHRLSLDVARRYRDRARGEAQAGAVATGSSTMDLSMQAELDAMMSSLAQGRSSMDSTLRQKSIPISHARFDWETNHSNHSSALLDQAVEDWKKVSKGKVNITSPAVVSRAEAFKNFTTSRTKAPAKTKLANTTPANTTKTNKTQATSLQQMSRAEQLGDQPSAPSRQSFLVQPLVGTAAGAATRARASAGSRDRTDIDDIVDEVMSAPTSERGAALQLKRAAK